MPAYRMYCEQCQRPFDSRTLNVRFCSPECLRQAEKELATCVSCGRRMFIPKPPGTRLYCSPPCAYQGKLRSNRLRRSPAKRHRKVCLECGTEFWAARPSAKYCSKSCSNRAAHRRWKEAHGRGQEGVVLARCEFCGEFFDPADEGARGQFCSERCARLTAQREERRRQLVEAGERRKRESAERRARWAAPRTEDDE